MIISITITRIISNNHQNHNRNPVKSKSVQVNQSCAVNHSSPLFCAPFIHGKQNKHPIAKQRNQNQNHPSSHNHNQTSYSSHQPSTSSALRCAADGAPDSTRRPPRSRKRRLPRRVSKCSGISAGSWPALSMPERILLRYASTVMQLVTIRQFDESIRWMNVRQVSAAARGRPRHKKIKSKKANREQRKGFKHT